MTSHSIESRYTIPTFVERTPTGVRETNPYSKLFEERVIFVGAPIDDACRSDLIAQLIYLEGNNPDRDIVMYFNSAGGSLTSMLSVYDTMQYVRSDVQTVCLGQVVGAPAVLAAGGTPGKRYILPNARAVLSQPSIEGVQGQVSDLQLQSEELQRLRTQLEATLAYHTGHTPEQMREALDRERIMTATDAVEFGLVDHVMPYRKARV